MEPPRQPLSVHDGPVEAALADYFLVIDLGQRVDIDAIIAAHPGCEEGLRRFLSQERQLQEAVAAAPLAAMQHENLAGLAGRTLGDFRLGRIIGRGGMGVVCEAEQVSLRRKVAVKLLPAALCSDPRHRTRFQNEARILAQLAHPNIVSVIAVGEEPDTYYFAMQLVEGMTADDLIRQWSDEKPLLGAETVLGRTADTDAECPGGPSNGRDSDQVSYWANRSADRHERYRLCARIASNIAAGLAHAHACGVLHRDVKPSNILLDKNGLARLSDFGLARMYGDATLTATGIVLGTLRYASPEQLGGSQSVVDERSDVYSLGVTLWELVTRKRLFASDDRNAVISQVLKAEPPRPSLLASGLPRDLETIIGRAMAKEPADRYASAQAFAEDLRRFLDGRPILARPISLGERAFGWANRNRILATSAIASLVVIALVALTANLLILKANSRTSAALATSRNSERKTHDTLYAADMALAGAAWHKNQLAKARMLLDRYRRPISHGDGSMEDDPRGFEWYFLDRQTRPRSELLFQNDKALYLIEFMPSGKEFFTAGQDSIVRWHDANTGKVLRSLDTKQLEINDVSYNPAGTLFATAGDDGTVKVFNAATQSLLQSIKVCDGMCHFAKFVDDQQVYVGGDIKTEQLYDAPSGKLVREYLSPLAMADGVISPGATYAHVGRSTNRLWIRVGSYEDRYDGVIEWDLNTGKSQRIIKDATIRRVLADKSERFLFISTSEGEVRILDAMSGTERWSTRLEDNWLEALTLSPDEHKLAVGDQTGQVYLWNLDLSNSERLVTSETPEKLALHHRDVNDIVFTADGKGLVTVSRDGSLRRTPLGAQVEAFHDVAWLAKKVDCAAIPRTKLIVATGPLAIYDRTTGKLIKTLSLESYHVVAASSDGKYVAAASSLEIGVWRIATGERIFKVEQKVTRTSSLDFSPDSTLLAVCTHYPNGNVANAVSTTRLGSIRQPEIDMPRSVVDVIEIATGKSTRYTGAEHSPSDGYFCSGGGLIERYGHPYQLTAWNLHDKTMRWQTRSMERRVSHVAPSRDRTKVIASQRRALQLIDCADGAVQYEMPCDYDITCSAFLGDGSSFVTGGKQGQISIWNSDTGQQLFELANVGTPIDSIRSLENGFLASTLRVKDGQSEVVWLEF